MIAIIVPKIGPLITTPARPSKILSKITHKIATIKNTTGLPGILSPIV